MKTTLADRRKSHMRAFVWLCDECPEGKASVAQMGRVICGTLRGGPLQRVSLTLHRLGWAVVTIGPKETQPVTSGTIQITPYGWLMRDYMKHEGELAPLDRVEMFAQIRALRMLLAPLARAGLKYRNASQAQRDILRIALAPLGLSVLQLDMAAAILYPERGFDKLVFPWTPGYIARERRKLKKGGSYADDIATDLAISRSGVRNESPASCDRSRHVVPNAATPREGRREDMAHDSEVDGAGLSGVAGIDQRNEPSEP